MREIRELQATIFGYLKDSGWRREGDRFDPQTNFIKDGCVIGLSNQGFGELNWVGMVEVSDRAEDYDLVAGYVGEEAPIVVSVRLTGDPNVCTGIEMVPNENAPRGFVEVEFASGPTRTVIRQLEQHTMGKVRAFKRPHSR